MEEMSGLPEPGTPRYSLEETTSNKRFFIFQGVSHIWCEGEYIRQRKVKYLVDSQTGIWSNREEWVE